jgi:beta-phosphoglucomutase-like phosphatase (HAD superfamily)
MLRALVFDLDGTLADTEELHRRAFNQAFLEFDLGWNWGPDLYAELLRVSGGADRIARHIDRLGHSAAEKTRLRRLVPLLHRAKTRIYGEFVATAQLMPRPGVRRLIGEARAADLRIGVAATSISANVLPLLVAALGPELAAGVSAVVSADQVARKKPAPDLYELLLATLRVPAADCVAFEDSSNGLAAAKAAGLYTVVTPSRWTLAQDFSRADLLLPTLGEFGLARLQALRATVPLHEASA